MGFKLCLQKQKKAISEQLFPCEAGNIMRKRKKGMKIISIVFAAVFILLLIIYINHQIHLREESELRLPLGQVV